MSMQFSFLRRKTDFFVGAEPEQVESLVMKVLQKHATLSAHTEKEKQKEREKEEKKRKARIAKQKQVIVYSALFPIERYLIIYVYIYASSVGRGRGYSQTPGGNQGQEGRRSSSCPAC
jgi:hypothetical protein